MLFALCVAVITLSLCLKGDFHRLWRSQLNTDQMCDQLTLLARLERLTKNFSAQKVWVSGGMQGGQRPPSAMEPSLLAGCKHTSPARINNDITCSTKSMCVFFFTKLLPM